MIVNRSPITYVQNTENIDQPVVIGNFASCSSSNSSEKKWADLHSKKEGLIDEISSDFVAIKVASIEGTGIEPEILTKAIKLGLSGICGVLERKELVAVDEDFLLDRDHNLRVRVSGTAVAHSKTTTIPWRPNNARLRSPV